MLIPYSRDSAYFKSLNDRNMTVAYRDLDLSFNKLFDFINNLLPTIEKLKEGKVVGIENNIGYLVRNIGDGTTIFDRPTSNDISNFSISLSKIEKLTENSLLFSNSLGYLKSLQHYFNNDILINNNGLKFSKLKFNHFEDASIISQKLAVGTLSARHIAAGIVGKPLTTDSIITAYIQDNTIPAQKIVNGAFSNTKISATLMNTRATGVNLEFKDKCFTARTIFNNSVDIKEVFFHVNSNNPNIKHTSLYGILSPANIPLNAIELKKVKSPHTEIKLDAYRQMDSSILPSKVKAGSLSLPNIRNAFNGWVGITTNTLLSKNNLSPEVKAILVKKGGLKP